MNLPIIGIAALLFGLILEVSAFNLHRRHRPRGEVLPLALIGAVFLVVGLFRIFL
ncbi:hypothetical protein [Thiohalorhabdus methylotrophus]|uniref:Uncharacterized protein n=1 Tax=Thiohalorhabdus methylotrophus TaxID=3242694 RepID=A0ABV4TXL6_9GAMM